MPSILATLHFGGSSPRTQAHYLRNVRQFLIFYNLPPDQLDTEKIKDYLYHLLDTQKASDSKIRQAHGSLKYLFTQTLARPWEIESIPQIKKKRTLPSVLSIEEISRLLSSCSNLKHQAMLMLIYSSGLRLSEAVSVQLTDIKRNQKRILIRQGKGAKDRYVILSDLCLNTLERYWRRYRPETFLFPGRNGKALSPRACQHAFYTAKESAGIHKAGGVHKTLICDSFSGIRMRHLSASDVFRTSKSKNNPDLCSCAIGKHYCPQVLWTPSKRSSPLTVNEIIREYGDAFLDAHPFLPLQEKKVLRAISLCRTPALGGHIDVCEDCGHTTMHYHSCRNRHCPQCQFLKQAKWIAEREQELLPFQYFLVVFTLPDELNPLVLRNKKLLCNLLFQKGKETLCSVAQAEKYFGARIGFFAILHTWGQKLNLHPHVHCVVPGGGYDEKSKRWKRAPQDYLFPVAVLKQRFRSLFLTELKKLYTNDDLYVAGTKYQDYQTFRILINSLFQKDWVVYMKESFRSPGSVIKYLGKYTHRIAISNYRIVKVEHDIVSFRYTDYKDGNAKKVMSLPVFSFIKRLLLHVVPRRFVRIRFFGILANRNKADFLKSCHTYFKTTQMQKKNALRSDRIDAYTDRNRCAALFSLWI